MRALRLVMRRTSALENLFHNFLRASFSGSWDDFFTGSVGTFVGAGDGCDVGLAASVGCSVAIVGDIEGDAVGDALGA